MAVSQDTYFYINYLIKNNKFNNVNKLAKRDRAYW